VQKKENQTKKKQQKKMGKKLMNTEATHKGISGEISKKKKQQPART